ncbi:uncharacterized protein LOC144115431 [Amblyomma americanum]
MLKNVVQALALGALFVFLAAGHPLPEEPESSPAAEARADDIAHAVEQVSADGVASPDGSPEAAVVETAAAGAVPGEAAGEVAPSSDGASEVAAAAGGAHGPLVVPLDAGAAPVPHVSGAVSGPGYEHESHQQAARQDAFSEAAQGAQQGSHAAESGEAFKKTEGFENQGGFRKQEGFSDKSSNRYGSGFFQGSEGQHEFDRGDQHSFGVAGYGVHRSSAGVAGGPNYQELLKVGFVP